MNLFQENNKEEITNSKHILILPTFSISYLLNTNSKRLQEHFSKLIVLLGNITRASVSRIWSKGAKLKCAALLLT